MKPRPSASSSPSSPASSPASPWMVWLGVLALAVPMLLAGAWLGLRHAMIRLYSPEQLAEIQHRINDPVVLPPEQLRPKHYAADAVAAEERVRTVVDTDLTSMISTRHDGLESLHHLQRRGPVSEEAWTSLSLMVSVAHRILQTTSASAALASYEMNAGPLGLGQRHNADYFTADPACAAAHLSARRHRWAQAFAWALLPLRRARHDPANIGYGLHTRALITSARSLSSLALDCTSPLLLRKTLVQMNEMRPRIIHEGSFPQEMAWPIGFLREAAAAGYPVTLVSGRHGAWYWEQALEIAKHFGPWMAEKLPAGDPHRKAYQNFGNRPDQGMEYGGVADYLSPKLMRMIAPEHYYGVLWGYFWIGSGSDTSRDTSRAMVDLARIVLAQRIGELTGRPAVGSTNELVPEFLPSDPVDPFSGKPFPLDPATGRFYSIGPDKIDGRGYPPYCTNSLRIRPGDILLPEPDTLPVGAPPGRI